MMSELNSIFIFNLEKSVQTVPYLKFKPLNEVEHPLKNKVASTTRLALPHCYFQKRRKEKLTTMATRLAARFSSRRFFSSGTGKVLSEEEKAAENAYFKKAEQEKLEKLARKGPQPEATPGAGSGGSVTGSTPSGSGHAGTTADKVSTDKYRNYAVVAGTITFFGALGWYLKGTAKKPEVQD
ncbi:hypothetical protein RJT34_31004 [Clitoria ternatea]|uniref:Copper ion binding protein n=1 Tax=Clitoria ternatea TaxID=43366 RepID=A0AAN9EXY5_CLITE